MIASDHFSIARNLGRRIWLGVYRLLVPPYRTIVIEEALPRVLRRRILYVVQEDGFREQAAMLCPCGCGRVLHMNLLPDERPCWRLTDTTTAPRPFILPSGGRRTADRISGFGEGVWSGADQSPDGVTEGCMREQQTTGDEQLLIIAPWSLATDLPHAKKAQFGKWRISAGYGGLISCGKKRRIQRFSFHMSQLSRLV